MINVVVALQCEAKPLIRHFGLTGHNAAGGYRVYQNRQLQLIVSGVGSAASAAAVAFLFAATGQVMNAVWLNLGVAGHGRRPLGTPLLAHKISEADTGRSWYPPRVFESPCESGALCTVMRPEACYAGDCAYDMEASGFYAAANRFATAELVQVLKVVSDNAASGPAKVSTDVVEGLMTDNLPVVDRLMASLAPLAAELAQLSQAPDYFDELTARWHFSAYQRRQLQALLRRWQALAPDEHPLGRRDSGLGQAREVLVALTARLDALPVMWP